MSRHIFIVESLLQPSHTFQRLFSSINFSSRTQVCTIHQIPMARSNFKFSTDPVHKCLNTNTVRKIVLWKDPNFFDIFQSSSDPSMIFTFQCTVGTIYYSVLTVLTFVKILSYLCSSFQQLHFMSHFINSNRSNNLLCPTSIPTSGA